MIAPADRGPGAAQGRLLQPWVTSCAGVCEPRPARNPRALVPLELDLGDGVPQTQPATSLWSRDEDLARVIVVAEPAAAVPTPMVA